MSEQDPVKESFLDLLENNGSGSFAFSSCSFGLVFCRWCRQKVIGRRPDRMLFGHPKYILTLVPLSLL